MIATRYVNVSQMGLEVLSKELGKLAAEYGDGYVKLFQHPRRKAGSFAVLYGQELHTGLSYSEAAAKLGQAIMHHQACEGLVDNGRD